MDDRTEGGRLDQLDHSAGRWIAALYRSRKGYVNRRLEPFGIGSGQFIFLMALYWKGGLSQERISDYLKIDKTTTAKVLKKLEIGGFVVRETDRTDRRTYKIYLTQKAQDLMPVILETVRQWEDSVKAGIPEDKIRTLESVLYKMALNADRIARLDSKPVGPTDTST
jgi:DNA-binding MarR family transcriptional regulator